MCSLKERNNMNRHYLKKCTDEEITNAIKNSFSCSQAVISLGYNPTERYRIKQFANEHNLSIEHFSRVNQRTHSLNEDFFDTLNPLSAYWLGFIMADGCIHEKNHLHQIKIHLAIKDEQHLLNFCNDIEYGGKLSYHKANSITAKGYTYATTPSVTASITSKKLTQSIINLGCIPNKTKFGCQLSDAITDDLFPHFLRGYFDGDGSIVIDNQLRKGENSIKQLSLFLLGDHDFLDTIRNRIVNILDVNLPKISKRQGIDCVKWAGNKQCMKIYDWMYKDAERYLSRKKEKYDEFKEYYLSRQIDTI
jgi:hypothetical protein